MPWSEILSFAYHIIYMESISLAMAKWILAQRLIDLFIPWRWYSTDLLYYNWGKFIIAIRTIMLKQYTNANDSKFYWMKIMNWLHKLLSFRNDLLRNMLHSTFFAPFLMAEFTESFFVVTDRTNKLFCQFC